jgi:hypothetical protein
VSYSIYTLRLELYSGSAADNARFAAEIILAALILLLVILYMRYVVVRALAGNRPGGPGWKKELRRYFMSPAHWTDFLSNALLVTCTALWWRFVNGYANNFNMALRYPVGGRRDNLGDERGSLGVLTRGGGQDSLRGNGGWLGAGPRRSRHCGVQ